MKIVRETILGVLLILLVLVSSAKASTINTSVGMPTINVVSQTYIDSNFNWSFTSINKTRWTAAFTIDPAFWSSTKTCLSQTGASRNTCFQNLCTSNLASQINCSNMNNMTKLTADLANMSGYPLVNLTANLKFSNLVIDAANGNGTFYIDFPNGFKVGEMARFGFGSTVVNTTTQGAFEAEASYNHRYFYVPATGLHWAFYTETSGGLCYSTSPDNSTWTYRGNVTTGDVGWESDIWVNGTNMSYATYNSNTNGKSVKYRLGNLNSNGNITWAATEQTVGMAKYIGQGGGVSITLNSTGYPWIEFKNYTGAGPANSPWVISSTTNNGTWTNDTATYAQLSTTTGYYGIQIVPLPSGKMLAIYAKPGAKVGAKLWNGSAWGSEVNTTSNSPSAWSSSNTFAVQFGAVQDPTNPDLVDLVFVNNTNYSLIFTQYNDSTNTWNTTETVVNTSLTSTTGVALSSASNGDLYAFWINSTTKVVYNKYTASSGTWGAATTLVTDTGITATYAIMSSYNASDSNISIAYVNNTGSPYNLKYVVLNVSSPAGGTCGLSLSSAINYGTINAGSASTQDANYITVTNSGSTATNVQINGTAWVHNSNNFAVSYTHYYNATGKTYAQKTALSTTATTDYYSLGASANYNSYLDVQAGPNAQQIADTYYENVTYTSSC